MKLDRVQIALAVMAHAREHYTSGWDVIVECYDVKDLDDMIAGLGATTVEGAIRAVGREVGIWDDRRRDIEAEAF